MNQIVNMSRYRNRQNLARQVGSDYMYCGWGNRRLGFPTSPLANPYSHKSNARANRIRVANRDEAVEMYRIWLWQKICSQDQAVLEALHQITPTTALVCWCAPKRCHCEVLGAAAAWIEDVTKFTYQIIEHGLASWAADGASGVCDFTTIEDLRKEVFSCLFSSRFL